jgi:hypothetical protein
VTLVKVQHCWLSSLYRNDLKFIRLLHVFSSFKTTIQYSVSRNRSPVLFKQNSDLSTWQNSNICMQQTATVERWPKLCVRACASVCVNSINSETKINRRIDIQTQNSTKSHEKYHEQVTIPPPHPPNGTLQREENQNSSKGHVILKC